MIFWRELKAQFQPLFTREALPVWIGVLSAVAMDRWTHGPTWETLWALIPLSVGVSVAMTLKAAQLAYVPNFERWPRAGKIFLGATVFIAIWVSMMLFEIRRERQVGGYVDQVQFFEQHPEFR